VIDGAAQVCGAIANGGVEVGAKGDGGEALQFGCRLQAVTETRPWAARDFSAAGRT
jgi:hypothetical protein